jgi:hypothetical protein
MSPVLTAVLLNIAISAGALDETRPAIYADANGTLHIGGPRTQIADTLIIETGPTTGDLGASTPGIDVGKNIRDFGTRISKLEDALLAMQAQHNKEVEELRRALDAQVARSAEAERALDEKAELLESTTPREYTGRIVVNGDSDTCYPVLFSVFGGKPKTLQIERSYVDQSPENFTATSHRPSLSFEVEFMNSHWGGIGNFMVVKRHMFEYHQTICKVELAKPARDAVVVWVVGGGKGGISYSISADFAWEGKTNRFFGEDMVNGQALYKRTYNYVSEDPQYSRYVEPVSYAALKTAGDLIPETPYGKPMFDIMSRMNAIEETAVGPSRVAAVETRVSAVEGRLDDPLAIGANHDHIGTPPIEFLVPISHGVASNPEELFGSKEQPGPTEVLGNGKLRAYTLGDGMSQYEVTVIPSSALTNSTLAYSGRNAVRLVATRSESEATYGGMATYPGLCMYGDVTHGESMRVRFIARLPVGFYFKSTGNYASNKMTSAVEGTGKLEYYSYQVYRPHKDRHRRIAEGHLFVVGPPGTLVYDLVWMKIEEF